MIYLDSAATTLQKPPQVARACYRAVNELSTPGRGGHRAAMLAAETALECRAAAAKLFNVGEPDRIVFTSNATHALNVAIKTLISPGDGVVVSGYEHNAVMRPLSALGADVAPAVSGLFEPESAVRAFEQKIRRDTRAVVCTHVSNVFGYVLPIERIAAVCRDRGVPLIIDASQSAGCLEIDSEKLAAAFIAMPGHKGLYGPQGTGILICNHKKAAPLLEGGTGSMSESYDMPRALPDRLEAGTHNMVGVAGLYEGIKYVSRLGTEAVLDREKKLIGRAAGQLGCIKGVRTFFSEHGGSQSGVLSICLGATDCETVAGELSEEGIAVRAGLHCAPLAHRTAGTFRTGTVRISVSVFNTPREIDRAVAVIEKIAKKQASRA